MNTKNLQTLIKRVSVMIGLALGAFAVSAAAQVWNPAPPNPPSGNVEAPLNAGLNSQSKLGQLSINTDTIAPYVTGLTVFGKSVFEGSIQIKGGTPGDGKVLVSDASGNATWNPLAAPPPSCHDISFVGGPFPPGTDWFRVSVPTECINGMCSVVLKVFDSPNINANLIAIKVANVTQIREGANSAAFDYWVKPGSVNDGTSCTYGRNGTTDGCDTLVYYNDNLRLFDDHSSAESSNSNEWSYRDESSDSRYGVLSVCR